MKTASGPKRPKRNGPSDANGEPRKSKTAKPAKEIPSSVISTNSVADVNAVTQPHSDYEFSQSEIGARRARVKAAAIQYGELGFKIIPCHWIESGRKPPLIKNWEDDATCDVPTIKAWWKEWPDAMIGIMTGAACEYDVLDIDIKRISDRIIDGHVSVPDWEKISPLITATPSGGHHLWFTHDAKLNLKNWAGKVPGLDVRTTEGYVIAPPSYLPDGSEYRWHKGDPAKLEQMLFTSFPVRLFEKAKKPKPKDSSKTKKAKPQIAESAQTWLSRICDKLATTSTGRNSALNEAAYQLGSFVREGLLTRDEVENALREACDANGYIKKDGEVEFRRSMQSGLDNGIVKADLPHNLGKPRFSDSALAEAFAYEYEDRLRYVADAGKWYAFLGKHWEQSPKDFAGTWLIDWLAVQSEDVDDWGLKMTLGSTAKADSVMRAVKKQQLIVAMMDDFNRDDMLSITPGGVIDLRTGELLEHDPKYLITELTPITPAETSDCPKWKAFMNWAMEGDQEMIDYLHRVAGYCLTGDTREQALFYLYGATGAGKGTFVNTLTALMGNHHQVAPETLFVLTRNDQHPTQMAGLVGARMVTASEASGARTWDEPLIKRMTGGDPLTARFMRGDFFKFYAKFKIIMQSNDEPAVRVADAAMRRRLQIIHFNMSIENTPEKKISDIWKELVAEEGPAILRLFVEGCLEWQRIGLSPPQKVIEATNEFFESADKIGQFIDEHCAREADALTTTRLLWMVYGETIEDKDAMLPLETFSRLLGKKEYGLKRHRWIEDGRKVRGFLGVRLRTKQDDNVVPMTKRVRQMKLIEDSAQPAE